MNTDDEDNFSMVSLTDYVSRRPVPDMHSFFDEDDPMVPVLHSSDFYRDAEVHTYRN